MPILLFSIKKKKKKIPTKKKKKKRFSRQTNKKLKIKDRHRKVRTPVF